LTSRRGEQLWAIVVAVGLVGAFAAIAGLLYVASRSDFSADSPLVRRPAAAIDGRTGQLPSGGATQPGISGSATAAQRVASATPARPDPRFPGGDPRRTVANPATATAGTAATATPVGERVPAERRYLLPALAKKRAGAGEPTGSDWLTVREKAVW